MKNFSNIKDAIKDLRRGKMLIVVDSPDRENEGDFFMPAQAITPREVVTMIKQGSGILCVAITEQQRRRLRLPLMVHPRKNTERTAVNFTVSVNAASGITTGVSAHDRARTIKILANSKSRPQSLTRPGHVLGLAAHNGGLPKRAGHTEAAVTLARLAGFAPAGVLCEIVRADGKMAGREDLAKLSKKLKIRIITIKDLIRYVKDHPVR